MVIVACAMKWNGGYVWACKIMMVMCSPYYCPGFGSLGLMTSVLMTPDGKTVGPKRLMVQ